MTEADILASTYTDVCTVYRPGKAELPNGETVHRAGLEGRMVYENIPCALSSPSGGKLQPGRPLPGVGTDYSLFVRPEVDIAPKDTVIVTHLGKRLQTEAGLADRHPSHNNIPLKLEKVLPNE